MQKKTIFSRIASSYRILFFLLISTPLSAQEDQLLTLPNSAENIEVGLETDAYISGVNAYIWGYPLVRMERVIREYTQVPEPKPATSYRAPLNHIGWATELATPEAKDMPTANNDTLYMSAVVKLDEPYILHVPDTDDRYYVVDVFNMWQELEHYIGRRATGTKAADYALVPPGWKGELPKNISRLDVTTNKIWLWGRLRVEEGESMSPLHQLQKEFTLRPLSQMNNKSYVPKNEKLPPLPETGNDPLGFYTELGAALQSNPIPARDKALFGQFARFGLTENGFDNSKLVTPQRQGLKRAINDGPKVAISAVVTATIQRNGWAWATGLDQFGDNYPLRALISGPYLGGQGEMEAMYPMRSVDSTGQALTGKKAYVLRFKKAPPTDAFWSLTVYNAVDKMLVENPIARYKLGSDTLGLKTNSDGSFEVPLQHTQPNGAFAKNWLPTPDSPFYLILRLYQPNDEILSGTYQLPQVELVSPDSP